MLSRRYVKMRELRQDRSPGRTAPVEPLYETERRALAAATHEERSLLAGGVPRERSGDRAVARTTVGGDQ